MASDRDRHGQLDRALDQHFARIEYKARTNQFGNVEIVLSEAASRRLADIVAGREPTHNATVREPTEDELNNLADWVDAAAEDAAGDWGRL